MYNNNMDLKDKKILLVEDDFFIGEMLARRLRIAGATYVWAKDGEEGLKSLEGADIDLIVTDLMMANMDGYEMVKKIKKDERFKNIPIIVLTNRMSLTDENKRVKELGIEGMFIKSNTELGELIEEIVTVLKKDKK